MTRTAFEPAARHGLLCLLTLLAFVICCGHVRADETVRIPLGLGKTLVFLSVADGRKAILATQGDPFFATLGRMDAEIRLREPLGAMPRDIWMPQLTRLFTDSIQPWQPDEIARIQQAAQAVMARAEAISPSLIPAEWKFVKTDGSEESGGCYTRADTIFLSSPMLQRMTSASQGRGSLPFLIAHETAHVYSRLNPLTKEQLYRRLGYEPAGGTIDLGTQLEAIRLTNPDGPRVEHVLRVETPQGELPVISVIYSQHPQFDPRAGRTIFQYLKHGLFVVQPTASGWRTVSGQDGRLVQYTPEQLPGFFAKVGNNTRYVIHPDEVLAENLAILLTSGTQGATNGNDVLLLRDLESILRDAANPSSLGRN